MTKSSPGGRQSTGAMSGAAGDRLPSILPDATDGTATLLVTGTVRLDLTAVKPGRMRNRVAALAQAPDGARVVLVVGALAVDWPALLLLREHVRRLRYDVQGEVFAVVAGSSLCGPGRCSPGPGSAWRWRRHVEPRDARRVPAGRRAA